MKVMWNVLVDKRLCSKQSECCAPERVFDTNYSARKAITLIVEVANAGGAHMIVVDLTVSLVP
jgi:hypothetical protein